LIPLASALPRSVKPPLPVSIFVPYRVDILTVTTMWVAELLDEWQPTVIKGNAAEIGALANTNEVWQKSTATPTRILKTKPFFSLFCLRLKPRA
jgi:hydroxyethylthiazole kinase-like sugar kinase family protein